MEEKELEQKEVITTEEQQKDVDSFMSMIDKVPFINELVHNARNRAERRKLRAAEKRGKKIAKQMQIDKEAARELFMQTLLEKVKAKNEELINLENNKNNNEESEVDE